MVELSDEALNTVFRNARTFNAWTNQPVADETLQRIYELAKWGPTSANCGPARFVFLRSREAKQRLRPALSAGNVEKTMTAPVTVIVAYDLKFYEKPPNCFRKIPGCATFSPATRNWSRPRRSAIRLCKEPT